MNDRHTAAPEKATERDGVFVFIAAALIATLLYRLFVPAQEYPMRTAQVMFMLFDAGMILGLFSLQSRNPLMRALFVVALLAGIALFAIRFTSDASWWTGHLMYSLPPR
jgi:uncharacterized membrane protein